ncbi:site-specific DNA-methyltransferase [Haemophilus haemolyticus]|uniref:site-specific DNA-methyltransferase n=1 Tax=Haemophilus haemolyticus TaxID=726 RepID=UPI00025E67D2|nr:site-specific DNA-methyltransferase [Haemophilus haemolyticus]EIJ74314.1 DNA (cytosine-5-)-methyltransferase [Haemophilus haemolyticus HK386]OBX39282.1 DNA methylase [Haemophilus haemolyticus]
MSDLKMHTANLVAKNIEKLTALFPNCITETRNEQGEIIKGVDFDLLRQELSEALVEGVQERYTLNWVGRKESILTANAPIAKTLRPCREESVNFDTTENLFIEGDNLDALKLLQENYLGKVKMIYIDPPYNTGNDFIYNDDFAENTEEFLIRSNQIDEDGNRLIANTESNGRFHSDWLSMMYSRLRLARNLLTDDGVIFISIDDNELANLKRICDEIFGDRNFVDTLIWKKLYGGKNDAKWFTHYHDYILVYTKNKLSWYPNLLPRSDKQNDRYKNPDNDPRGVWKSADFTQFGPTPNCVYEIETPNGSKYYPPEGKRWITTYDKYLKLREDNRLWFGMDGGNIPSQKRYLSEVKQGISQSTFLDYSEVGHSDEANKELKNILGGKYFDYPKPTRLLHRLLHLGTKDNDLILDFFAGSGTTAHAVMQLNAEDNGNRKFICVQLPEKTDEKSEAFKAGYSTIAEITKERIRLAGSQILQNLDENKSLDVGFRVLKIDSSNMKDIYYQPEQYDKTMLDHMVSHIKEDRTAEDLLFQVMLDWGVELSLPIERKTIDGSEVYFVAGNTLVACFDKFTMNVVDEIAKVKPLRVVSTELAIMHDQDKTNIKERFKQLSSDTEVRFL